MQALCQSQAKSLQQPQRSYPKGVKNLVVTQNLPKKINLTWDDASFDDFSHYNVYRSASKYLPYTYLAKTSSNSFEDLINSNGSTRYYKVTVVDKDGLESLKQDEPVAGATLSQPQAPKITQINYDGSGVNLSWSEVNRAVSYTIYRKGGSGEKTISDLTYTSYTDNEIEPNASYSYKVVAIDEFGLSSDTSSSADISIK